MRSKYAIVLAGGIGSRAGGDLPKQFYKIGDMPLVCHSIKSFMEYDPACKIIVVVHPDYIGYWEREIKYKYPDFDQVAVTEGGTSRIQSVKNGLDFIKKEIKPKDPLPEEPIVFIHDGARPFITPSLIGRGERTVASGVGAIPVVPLSDSIRMKEKEGTKTVNRMDYVAVQTPQIFNFDEIYNAYSNIKSDSNLTDDASIGEKHGLKIITFEGDSYNIKITNPIDFKIAEHILSIPR